MRNIKILTLAAVAFMALMAFGTCSASASKLYSGTEELGKEAVIDFSLLSGRSWKLVDTNNNTIDTCKESTLKLKLSSNGPTITGENTEMTWGSCTFPTKTLTRGKLELVSIGGTNGEVKSDAKIEVTINTVLFGSCIYGFESEVNIGTLTTSGAGEALLDTEAVAVKFGVNPACPLTAKWTGTYTVTQPTALRIEGS